MKQFWKYLMIICAMVLMIQMPVYAASSHVDDEASLFTDQEIQELEEFAFAGSAFPFISFITCPVKNPIAFFLPLW